MVAQPQGWQPDPFLSVGFIIGRPIADEEIHSFIPRNLSFISILDLITM